MKKLNLVGKKFGRLFVESHAGMDRHQHARYNCVCSCGNKKEVASTSLIQGETKSCGCLRNELLLKHGLCSSREYKAWVCMKQRCTNKNNKNYKDYGKRGIKICPRWMKFENFYKDMGKCPEGMSLDRADNNLGYSKENCRWASWKEQLQNTSRNVYLVYNGEKKCLSEWARQIGISPSTLRMRLQKEWPIEKVFSLKKYRGIYDRR